MDDSDQLGLGLRVSSRCGVVAGAMSAGMAADVSAGKLCHQSLSTVIPNYPMSLCCWVRFTDKSTAQTVMAISNSAIGTVEYRLDLLTNGHARFTRQNGATVFSAVNLTDLSDGEWHLLCGVGVASDNASLQVDDQAPNLEASSVSPTDFTRVCIGDSASSLYSANYKGDVDQATLWDINLVVDQKNWLYNLGPPPTGRTYNEIVSSADSDNPGTDNLLAHYSLNEDAPAGIGQDDTFSPGILGYILTATGTVVGTDGIPAGD